MRVYETIERIDKSLQEEASRDPVRYHLGGSILGAECSRSLWYNFRWVSSERFGGRMLRLFRVGHKAEHDIVEDLRKAGVTVWDVDPETGRQFSLAPAETAGHAGGSADGVALGLPEDPQTPMLLEFKTHAEKSFKDLEKNGVAVSKPQHFSQCQFYMREMKLTKAFYVAVSKNNSDYYTEIIDYDPAHAEGLVERAKQIITSDRPLEKIHQDATWYKCKWCSFHSVCHGIQAPKFNCRTCVFATAELDGDARWSCEKHNKSLNGQDQLTGCDSHLFIPDLLEGWAKPLDADQDKNWVEYENLETGNKFRNGEGGFLSREIAIAKDVRVFGDELADTLRENFQAEVVG